MSKETKEASRQCACLLSFCILLLTETWRAASWAEALEYQRWSVACRSLERRRTLETMHLMLKTLVTGLIAELLATKSKNKNLGNQCILLRFSKHSKCKRSDVSAHTFLHLPWLESWAAWERIVVMLKADGPAVRILWSIDCKEACVTAAVRTTEKERKTRTLR